MGLQVLEERFIGHFRFRDAIIEDRQILLILAQRLAHGIVDDFRHGLVSVCRLQAQGLVQDGVEIDRGALGRFFSPDGGPPDRRRCNAMASRRQGDVCNRSIQGQRTMLSDI